MSIIDLTKADSVGYIPDISNIKCGNDIEVYRHFKGGYYIILGFSFDAETDRWKYGYLDAYLYRDIVAGKVLLYQTFIIPFMRTPENFHQLVKNPRKEHELVRRFTITPFMLSNLPDNKTLFD